MLQYDSISSNKHCVPRSFCFIDLLPLKIKLHLIAIFASYNEHGHTTRKYEHVVGLKKGKSGVICHPYPPQKPLSVVPTVAVVDRLDYYVCSQRFVLFQ